MLTYPVSLGEGGGGTGGGEGVAKMPWRCVCKHGQRHVTSSHQRLVKYVFRGGGLANFNEEKIKALFIEGKVIAIQNLASFIQFGRA